MIVKNSSSAYTVLTIFLFKAQKYFTTLHSRFIFQLFANSHRQSCFDVEQRYKTWY